MNNATQTPDNEITEINSEGSVRLWRRALSLWELTVRDHNGKLITSALLVGTTEKIVAVGLDPKKGAADE